MSFVPLDARPREASPPGPKAPGSIPSDAMPMTVGEAAESGAPGSVMAPQAGPRSGRPRPTLRRISTRECRTSPMPRRLSIQPPRRRRPARKAAPAAPPAPRCTPTEWGRRFRTARRAGHTTLRKPSRPALPSPVRAPAARLRRAPPPVTAWAQPQATRPRAARGRRSATAGHLGGKRGARAVHERKEVQAVCGAAAAHGTEGDWMAARRRRAAPNRWSAARTPAARDARLTAQSSGPLRC